MHYPLKEKIGKPELLVGREKEFANFNKWISRIPDMLSKSRVILARRKSGKTSFVQRIFNQLWSTNGQVIPFYFVFEESKIWYPDLAIKYYCAFASQYIAFFERDADLVRSSTSRYWSSSMNSKTVRPMSILTRSSKPSRLRVCRGVITRSLNPRSPHCW